MKRILVGVDGSNESRAAVKFAANIARATRSQLKIAFAVAPVIPTEGAPELVARFQELEENERQQAKVVLKDIASSIGEGVPVETLVLGGTPAAALAELARSGDMDLVVVGHRGRNAVARALLGSVADRLVQICPKPVLIVR
ncbi:MAG TPA: universal stress protein [Myxococcales bacterium]|jgi:nucleotide-binding universal stress UspA family protein|nr:universal stress protein [Myxococcales bacterium]